MNIMNNRGTIVLLFISLASMAYAQGEIRYDHMISDLAASPKRAKKAQAELLKAGKEAFPHLASRLTDETKIKAGIFNYRSRGMKTLDGKITIATPTIGEVAFDIIQRQIEGIRPIHHLALTPSNAKEWVRRNAHLSLSEMQLNAAKDSLRSIAEQIRQTGVNEAVIDDLEYVVARIKSIENNRRSSSETKKGARSQIDEIGDEERRD